MRTARSNRLCCVLVCLFGAAYAQSNSASSSTASDLTALSSAVSITSSIAASSVSPPATTLITTTSSALLSDIRSTSSTLIPSSSSSQDATSSTPQSIASQTASAAAATTNDAQAYNKISDETLAIIIGASIGAIALLFMLAIFYCAFHLKKTDNRSYARTPSPLGSDGASKVMQTITSRKLFSSRSANAPEVLHRSDSSASKGHRRVPPALQIYQPNSSEIGLALGAIDESPQLTPLSRSQHSLQQSVRRPSGERRSSMGDRASRRSSGEGRPSRPSMSKYRTRSIDVLDAAAARRSSEAVPLPPPPISPSYHRRSSADMRKTTSPFSPLSPHASVPSLRRDSSSPYYKYSTESLRSNDKLIAPLVPTKSPRRQSSSSPALRRPSWAEINPDDFDDSDGQRGVRERPSMALARRSGSWRTDHLTGRHELA